jgi:uncharacterized protein (TIGR00369 family)
MPSKNGLKGDRGSNAKPNPRVSLRKRDGNSQSAANSPGQRKEMAHGHDTKHVKLRRNFCFGCGPDNPNGMRLKFVADEENRRCLCRFKLTKRFGGPPGFAHGGIIATILDEAMGKVNRFRHVIALTSELTVNYLKPVPLGKSLVAVGWEKNVRGRRHFNVAEIRDGDTVLARSRGKFIAVDPEKMFAKYVK